MKYIFILILALTGLQTLAEHSITGSRPVAEARYERVQETSNFGTINARTTLQNPTMLLIAWGQDGQGRFVLGGGLSQSQYIWAQTSNGNWELVVDDNGQPVRPNSQMARSLRMGNRGATVFINNSTGQVASEGTPGSLPYSWDVSRQQFVQGVNRPLPQNRRLATRNYFTPPTFGTQYIAVNPHHGNRVDGAMARDVAAIRGTLRRPTNPNTLPSTLTLVTSPREIENSIRNNSYLLSPDATLAFSNHGTPDGRLHLGSGSYLTSQISGITSAIRAVNQQRYNLGISPLPVLLTQCFGASSAASFANATGSPTYGSTQSVNSYQRNGASITAYTHGRIFTFQPQYLR